MLEAGSGTKFQLLPLFDIVGPFLGLTRNLGARHVAFVVFGLEVHPIIILLSSSFDQRLSSHFVFALYMGCSKYKHS